MRGIGLAMVLLAMVLSPVAFSMTASAQEDTGGRDLTASIERGWTERFGGGEWIAVKAGDTVFGVVYGNATHPNKITLFAEYRRYLGGAEIFDNQDNYLLSRGIPIWTVLGQRFERLVEFRDLNNNSLLDFAVVDSMGDISGDVPVKALNLNTSWTLSDLTQVSADNSTYVNFTLSATNLQYSAVFDAATHERRPSTEADGLVEKVALTFHLKVDVRPVRIDQVPWYKVNVDNGNKAVVTHTAFLEYRNYTGHAVAMSAKYDHLIEGWDFVADDPKLALETHAIFGNFIPAPVARWVHLQYYRGCAHSDDEAHVQVCENETGPSAPVVLTRDRIYFDDDWYRVGRLTWVSDVEVTDSEGNTRTANMTFQVHRAFPIDFRHGLRYFRGFAVAGAYIYPQGTTIFHDPSFDSTAYVFGIPGTTNLLPMGILVLQLGVVSAFVVPALYLRHKKGRKA